jgi:hypothetical protein
MLRIVFCVLVMSSSGCSLYGMMGDQVGGYAQDHMIPHLLEYGDTEVACEAGVSLLGLLASFRRVTDDPHGAAIPTVMSAATCAQERLYEAELRSLRAINQGKPTEAADARIAEKYAHQHSAIRFYEAYKRTVKAFGEPGKKECPDFDSDYDELVWVLGLLSGVQATQHDRAAGAVVGIPLDTPVKIARGIACVKNEKWWGAPQAIMAAVWTSVPGASPKGVDPWAELAAASKIGSASGVRLANAIEMQANIGSGRSEQAKKNIEDFAKARTDVKSNEKWKTLDNVAARLVQAVSDRIWTQAVGHRTPFGELGTFPTEEKDDESEEDEDDLLENLEEDES